MKVQKLFIILLLTVSATACKKDYTCECTKIRTDGVNTIETQESIDKFKDTKIRATDKCNDKEKSGSDAIGTYTIECEIK